MMNVFNRSMEFWMLLNEGIVRKCKNNGNTEISGEQKKNKKQNTVKLILKIL